MLTGGILSGQLIKRGCPTVTSRKIPIVGGALLAAAAVLPVAYVENTVARDRAAVRRLFRRAGADRRAVDPGLGHRGIHQVASLGAIQNFGGFLGAALAPIVTGFILDETGGNYTLVFLIGGVLLIVGALSYGVFVKDRRTVAAA